MDVIERLGQGERAARVLLATMFEPGDTTVGALVTAEPRTR